MDSVPVISLPSVLKQMQYFFQASSLTSQFNYLDMLWEQVVLICIFIYLWFQLSGVVLMSTLWCKDNSLSCLKKIETWAAFFTCLFCSYEPPEWPEAAWEVSAHHAVQTHQCPASPWRPRGPGPDQRLQQLPTAPLQEARLQKLLQHLPTFCHFTPLQHPVSPWTAGASSMLL